MADTLPLINGKNYDWGNVEFIMLGVPVIGITEINYTHDKDSVNNYGMGNEPVSYGNKNNIYSGDITIFFDELVAIQRTAPRRSILNIHPFTATVIFGGDAVNYLTHKVKNIRFTKKPYNFKQNDGLMVSKLTFAYAGLEEIG